MNNKVKDILEKAYKQGRLDGFDFAIFMQNLLISKDGYVIGTGNWENVNAWECQMLCRPILLLTQMRFV